MYTTAEKILIWLSSFNLSVSKIHKVLKIFQTPENLLEAIKKQDQKLVEVFGTIVLHELFSKCSQKEIDSYVKNLTAQNIVCSTIISQTYPEKLKNIFEAPIVLYLKGDISLLNTKSVGIVGTRSPSQYGKGVTYTFAKNLAKAGLTIVSGLAIGIDKVAHQATLEIKGKTIAVLGAGFNYIYPPVNTNLAKEIEQKGLLVSEYAPSINPQKYTFPFRNRIIAGLSDVVLITEAGEHSGALYTKEYAIDFNRTVYAIPGNITSPTSKGTNQIIKNCQACCALSYEDILIDLGIQPVEQNQVVQLDINERLILSIVEKQETHYDELLNKTQLEPKKLNSCLTSMIIRGIIRKLPGNYYSI